MLLSAINSIEISTAFLGLFATSASCTFCPASAPLQAAKGSPFAEDAQVEHVTAHSTEFLLVWVIPVPPARAKGLLHISGFPFFIPLSSAGASCSATNRGSRTDPAPEPVHGFQAGQGNRL